MPQASALLISGSKTALLSPISLTGAGTTLAEGKYNESWLRDLIQAHPEILPVDEIISGFGRLVPVAREVPAGQQGSIDNLFVTSDGGICVVETKLWRNPQSRRDVVAQALDYASAVAQMTYERFERAALDGMLDGPRPASLHALVAAHDTEALPEAAFIDAVADNLKQGRLLVLAVGDGIRAETETLANSLQSHAGARFTFGLVAIELLASGEHVIAVPRTLTKTTIIERGVVRLIDGALRVEKPSEDEPAAAGKARTMTEELFMDTLRRRDPALPAQLRAFLDRIATIGVQPSWQGALNLKWYGWPEGAVNLGVISKEGQVWTDPTNWRGSELARPYQKDVAEALGVRVQDRGKGAFIAAPDGSYVQIDEVLPQRAEAWALAMERFIERLRSEAAAHDDQA